MISNNTFRKVMWMDSEASRTTITIIPRSQPCSTSVEMTSNTSELSRSVRRKILSIKPNLMCKLVEIHTLNLDRSLLTNENKSAYLICIQPLDAIQWKYQTNTKVLNIQVQGCMVSSSVTTNNKFIVCFCKQYTWPCNFYLASVFCTFPRDYFITYQVNYTFPLTLNSVQVECRGASLNTNDIFIIDTPTKTYVWVGKVCYKIFQFLLQLSSRKSLIHLSHNICFARFLAPV